VEQAQKNARSKSTPKKGTKEKESSVGTNGQTAHWKTTTKEKSKKLGKKKGYTRPTENLRKGGKGQIPSVSIIKNK